MRAVGFAIDRAFGVTAVVGVDCLAVPRPAIMPPLMISTSARVSVPDVAGRRT
jgi:hypothetical protein